MTSLGVEQLSTAAAGTGAGKYRVYGGGRASHVDTGEREGASTGGADGFASLASIGDSGSGARDAGDRDGKARRKHHKKHRRHHKHGSAEHSGAGSGGDASDEAGGGGEAGGAARRSRRHRHHRDKSDTGGGVSSPSARHRPPPSPASANPALSLNLKVVHDAKRGADKSYDEARLALSGLSPHALEELADLKPTKGFEYQVGMALCKLVGAPRKWKAVHTLLTNPHHFEHLVRMEPGRVKESVRLEVMRHMTEHNLLDKASSFGGEVTTVLIRWMSEVVKRAESQPLSVYRAPEVMPDESPRGGVAGGAPTNGDGSGAPSSGGIASADSMARRAIASPLGSLAGGFESLAAGGVRSGAGTGEPGDDEFGSIGSSPLRQSRQRQLTSSGSTRREVGRHGGGHLRGAPLAEAALESNPFMLLGNEGLGGGGDGARRVHGDEQRAGGSTGAGGPSADITPQPRDTRSRAKRPGTASKRGRRKRDKDREQAGDRGRDHDGGRGTEQHDRRSDTRDRGGGSRQGSRGSRRAASRGSEAGSGATPLDPRTSSSAPKPSPFGSTAAVGALPPLGGAAAPGLTSLPSLTLKGRIPSSHSLTSQPDGHGLDPGGALGSTGPGGVPQWRAGLGDISAGTRPGGGGGSGASPGAAMPTRTTVSVVSSAARSTVASGTGASGNAAKPGHGSHGDAAAGTPVASVGQAHAAQEDGAPAKSGDASSTDGATMRRVDEAITEGAQHLAARSMRIAALAAARTAVSTLTYRELAAAWATSSKAPGAKVLLGISGALCVLFNRTPTWDVAREIVLSEGFTMALVGLSPADVSERCLRIMTAVSLDQRLAHASRSSGSNVIRALAAWVAAMTGTHTKTHMEAAANGIVARLLAAQAGGHVATVSGGPDSMSSESKARTDALYNIATTSDTFIQLRKLARRASAVREGVNASEAASTAPGGAAAAAAAGSRSAQA